MNKTVTIDLDHAVPANAAAARLMPAHPQSLLDLPPGEARESLLSVHGLLGRRLPATGLAIYEAGGGSTSFLPLDVPAGTLTLASPSGVSTATVVPSAASQGASGRSR